MKTPSLAMLAPRKASEVMPAKQSLDVLSSKQDNLLTNNSITTRQPPTSREKVLVAFRMTKAQKKALERLALDLDMTVQALLLQAIDDFKQAKGIR